MLYEMLTGRRAFPGEDVTDTIVSVVSKEPDWPALPSSTPAHVRLLLRRCLDKDPKRRLRDIGEARLALDGAIDMAGDVGRVPRSGPAGSAGPGLHPLWRRALPWAVASLFFTGLAALSFVHFGQASPPDPLENGVEVRLKPDTTYRAIAESRS